MNLCLKNSIIDITRVGGKEVWNVLNVVVGVSCKPINMEIVALSE